MNVQSHGDRLPVEASTGQLEVDSQDAMQLSGTFESRSLVVSDGDGPYQQDLDHVAPAIGQLGDKSTTEQPGRSSYQSALSISGKQEIPIGLLCFDGRLRFPSDVREKAVSSKVSVEAWERVHAAAKQSNLPFKFYLNHLLLNAKPFEVNVISCIKAVATKPGE